jgi:hypothetical protein
MTQDQIAFLKMFKAGLPSYADVTELIESPQGLWIHVSVSGPQHPRQVLVFPDQLQESLDNGTLSKRIRQDLTEAMRGTKASWTGQGFFVLTCPAVPLQSA